jgi:retron-type reverse transcriptase
MREHVTVHKITTNGGRKRRTIYAPSPTLSWVQNQIRKNLLLSLDTEDCVHGFIRGRGTVSNAMVHAGERKTWVMNIDLKDFFPGITFPRVLGLYRRLFNVSDKMAVQLARLTTYDNHLAQGFCTSPDLANFVAWKLDRRLMALAKKMGIGYTRYADDLTFSCVGNNPTPDAVRSTVTKIVADEDLRVNERKVAIMRSGRRQVVTGLVVSEHGVNVPRRTRRLLRSAVHHWRQQDPERRASIRGWISYIQAVDPHSAQRLLDGIEAAEADENRTWTQPVSSGPFAHDIKSYREASR